MVKLYKYTLLRQDGAQVGLTPSKKKMFSELYLLLDCSTIQIIPRAYYPEKGRHTIYGDEEGRFKEGNIRNPYFNELKSTDHFGGTMMYDVVGDCIKEEVLK